MEVKLNRFYDACTCTYTLSGQTKKNFILYVRCTHYTLSKTLLLCSYTYTQYEYEIYDDVFSFSAFTRMYLLVCTMHMYTGLNEYMYVFCVSLKT